LYLALQPAYSVLWSSGSCPPVGFTVIRLRTMPGLEYGLANVSTDGQTYKESCSKVALSCLA